MSDYVTKTNLLSALGRFKENADNLYETKADASDLKDSIDALQKQIDNITEAEDLLSEVEYSNGENAVPANVSKYAEVTKLRGVSRVENNLVMGVIDSILFNGITFTKVDNATLTVSGTATQRISKGTSTPRVPVVNGHSYLLFGMESNTQSVGIICNGYSSSGYVKTFSGRDVGAGLVVTIDNANVTLFELELVIENGTTLAKTYTLSPNLVDLNIYFNTTDLSFLGATDSAKLATIQTNYPHLLIPSDYGTRIIDWTGNGVRAWARNLWDEEWLNGYYNYGSGEFVASSQHICSKNYIPVLGGVTYYSMQTGGYVCYYDKDEVFISSIDIAMYGPTFTPPANCAYIMFNCGSAYGATYQHNICINQSDSQNGTYTPYHAPTTLSFPSTTLKSAGSVAEEYYPETGRVTHPIGSYTFTGNETGYSVSSVGRVYLSVAAITSIMKIPSSRSIKANILSTGWITVDDDHLESNSMQISVTTLGQIGFCLTKTTEAGSADALKAYLQNHPTTIYFELATPDPDTYVDPIPDPFIQVEGGGTIKPVQNNEPEIDSAMTVTYTNKVTA